jgi:hypothetical protein
MKGIVVKIYIFRYGYPCGVARKDKMMAWLRKGFSLTLFKLVTHKTLKRWKYLFSWIVMVIESADVWPIMADKRSAPLAAPLEKLQDLIV